MRGCENDHICVRCNSIVDFCQEFTTFIGSEYAVQAKHVDKKLYQCFKELIKELMPIST